MRGSILDPKIWEPLQRFESRDYLARHYQKRHGRSLNGQRANEIGSCFAQGREYFVSASKASDTVKPLLLYYGCASLARGVTLLKDRDKREENLTPGHGLITVNWPKTLHDGIANVLSLQVQATRGTFSEFVLAVGNGQSYSWLNPENQLGHFKKEFGEMRFLKDGSTISLDDLVSRERDLAAEYEIANDGWGNTDFGFVVAHEDSLKVLFIPFGEVNLATAIASYGFPDEAKIIAQPVGKPVPVPMVAVEIPATGEDRKRIAPMALAQDKSLGWLVRPFQNGDNIIDLHRMYLQAFILGMLCRYFPSKWMTLLRSDKGDIARSVVLSAGSRIEAGFAKLLQAQLH